MKKRLGAPKLTQKPIWRTLFSFIGFCILISAFLIIGAEQILQRRERWGEVYSPARTYVVTIIHESPRTGFLGYGGDGLSYFHLDKRRWYVDWIPGGARIFGSDVLVLYGHVLPYGITWLDENHLQIRLRYPIEYEYDYYGTKVKIYRNKRSTWGQVKIGFGVLGDDETSDPREVTIDPS